jgi:uncharacterized protein (TIGR02145 family)
MSLFSNLFKKKNQLNGNDYSFESVEIDKQIWMSKNLNVSHFRNGDPIPEVKTDEEWNKAWVDGTAAYCYYNNKPKNGKIYGKLYNWFAVNDPRGLAPEGWKIPSNDEWAKLMNMSGYIGDYLREKGHKHWAKPDRKTYYAQCKNKASDRFGFKALPGGYRTYQGPFEQLGQSCYWWTATFFMDNMAWKYSIKCDESGDSHAANWTGDGYSVRCLKIKETRKRK